MRKLKDIDRFVILTVLALVLAAALVVLGGSLIKNSIPTEPRMGLALRRVDDVLTAAALKEVARRNEIKEKVSALSDDDLCAGLNNLLTEYRSGQKD